MELARAACDTLGILVEIDPGEALLNELWEAEGNVAFYRALVQQLPTHPEPDLFVVGEGEDDDGHWDRGETGVYGRTYHQSGIPTGEAKPHILVQLYNDERKHRLAVETACLKAGVEERRVRMIEADATKILGAQIKALVDMGLADRLEEFRAQFVTALRDEANDGRQPAALGAAIPG